MHKDKIPKKLSSLAFDFFYWFSRFEFCLKDNRYLKHDEPGANAEPGWDKFVAKHAATYKPSREAKELLAAPPERQIILANGELDWQPVGIADCKSDLAKIARLVKTVRNNLFHGGKHGAAGWDNPTRTQSLLSTSKAVLGQLAILGGFEGDYERLY
jgi:hypothetical protein